MTRRDVTGEGAGTGLSGRGVMRMVVSEFLAVHFPRGAVMVVGKDGVARTESWGEGVEIEIEDDAD